MLVFINQSCRTWKSKFSLHKSVKAVFRNLPLQSYGNKSQNPSVLPLREPVLKGSTRWDRTANQFRQMHAYKAVIHEIRDCSDTVRSITLKVSEPGLTFSAGQWVDFFIPNMETVAGFSMTSPPYLAEEKGILDLDVKYSKYPPTDWVHKKCSVGDTVTIRVGGEFFYHPKPGSDSSEADLLLIGGGVGINPMASIAQHYAHILEMEEKGQVLGIKPGRLKLLYSAKNLKELVRKELFENLEKKVPSMSCQFFATKESAAIVPSNVSKERISKKELAEALNEFSGSKVLCYICGPVSMIDSMEKLLQELGIKKDCIKYEKWE